MCLCLSLDRGKCYVESPTLRLRQVFDKETRDYQLYRIRFSNVKRKWRRLFDELKTYNDRFEELLAASDIVS